MTAEVKLRLLAGADPVLQADLGTTPFRWFDKQLPQGMIGRGSCVRILRVSTGESYAHNGRNTVTGPRFQIDILDTDAETARLVAADIVAWLSSAHLDTDEQFTSPPTTPHGCAANFVLNQRAGMLFDLSLPVHVETLDVRVTNLEN